jgi:hypothetical protein
MIATRTMSLMVTMAILGIVPVAAHAQPISVEDLISQLGTASQDSSPEQDTVAVQTDNDENTNTPINFVLVSQGALSTASTTITAPFEATDDDDNSNAAAGVQEAPLTLTLSQAQEGTQMPTANPIDLLGLIPGTG